MIIMDSVVIPRPPPMPLGVPPSSGGFRLMEDQGDASSVYSVYKQKIDAMFESDYSPQSSPHRNGGTPTNSVQARIERMFTDVAQDGGLVVNPEGTHSFSVDYLGSVGLNEKVTSLGGLQEPLKNLYFAYKRTTKMKKALTGRLEISGNGLKVQYQGEKGDLEQLNPFPTIAVWSAVKFVIQKTSDNTTKFAFLPLITDPDNIDKRTLFRLLNDNEKKFITPEAHSPIFAVVMRKIGIQKQLECHGFVCQTSEDAIVIAATLYKSLMSHMKSKEKKPKNRNGITCISAASSTLNTDLSNVITPVRPPRKKKSSTTSSIVSGVSETQPLIKKSTKNRRAPKTPEDFDAILPYEEPVKTSEIKPKTFSDQINTYMSREQKEITAEIKQVMSEGTNRGLKPVPIVRKLEGENSLRKKENSGDILTKVTIPRSGSFLNAGGLTRYKSKVSRANGQATGGSPLGFHELFNEFRLQEGLHSMDDILGVIIDPEGMSFNDLKPIYKEFLLKLSVTLTKDELFQRSKLIMRRHRKKLLKKGRVKVGGKFRRLKHVFQKFKTLKKPSPSKFFKVKLVNSSTNHRTVIEAPPPDPKLPESSISTSSYDTRHFVPKQLSRPASRKKPSPQRTSTSEESDFFSLRKNQRNSSSGYVSCSECSYDSDTCTCRSADKCYCSLGNKNTRKSCCHQDATFCGCDTDSCTESNKCYCQNVPKKVQQHKKLCRRTSNTKSTKSLEYVKGAMEGYYEKLGNTRKRKSDYEILGKGSYSSIINQASRYPHSEALAVKKTAEIAALFTDLKLTQTTDVAHLRNAYNKLKSQSDLGHYAHRMVQNGLYVKGHNRNNMYSARNGLYTIQSQSDESGNSSYEEKKKFLKRNMGLESSLGYLP